MTNVRGYQGSRRATAFLGGRVTVWALTRGGQRLASSPVRPPLVGDNEKSLPRSQTSGGCTSDFLCPSLFSLSAYPAGHGLTRVSPSEGLLVGIRLPCALNKVCIASKYVGLRQPRDLPEATKPRGFVNLDSGHFFFDVF